MQLVRFFTQTYNSMMIDTPNQKLSILPYLPSEICNEQFGRDNRWREKIKKEGIKKARHKDK